MRDRLRFLINRLRERLWVRPLALCLLSVGAVFLAHAVDGYGLDDLVPEVSRESVDTLLSVLSASMLVISTFSVASMVASYAEASRTATPRAFVIVIADDGSQNALSTFIGAFIYSIVAQVAVQNSYYGTAGLFALFVLTLFVFATVVLTFVRWVDQIARLGRLGNTIKRVEIAANDALEQRRRAPTLGAHPLKSETEYGELVHASFIGYVQRVDVASLQEYAQEVNLRIDVLALPGTFATPGRPLAGIRVDADSNVSADDLDRARICEAFVIGEERVFDEDPRFGLVALSEIASRALSPAVNDPGTAIRIIGSLVRLLARWAEPLPDEELRELEFDRIAVPELSARDLFDDAFYALARDGAAMGEVMVRLAKALHSLSELDNTAVTEAAGHHARLACQRADHTLALDFDRDSVRDAARFAL